MEAIISLASWEPRFLIGMENILDKYKTVKHFTLYYFKEYAHKTLEARTRVKSKINNFDIQFLESEISFNNANESWRTIFNTLYIEGCNSKHTLIDITTMPREIIWTVINILKEKSENLYYIYNSPHSYHSEWLSRDPKIPRLVYKLSGISKLGRPTKLVLITGFDLERSKQLITHFEPETTLVGIQKGAQFDNLRLNEEKHKAEFTKQQGFEIFYIDAYSNDNGLKTIEQYVNPHLNNANVILSSLGPKLTSISLFKYHTKHPETGLVYAPSGEYNIDYSNGIGKSYFGEI